MKIVLATAEVAVLSIVAASLGAAQTTTHRVRSCGCDDASTAKLPAEIANRKRLIAGVKCDTPPFGYLDVKGKNAGVDVEIAKQLARPLRVRPRQRLTFVCAPTARAAVDDEAASTS